MDNKVVKDTIGDIFNGIANALETGTFGKKTRVGITILGNELGKEEIVLGAEKAQYNNPEYQVVVIGNGVETSLEMVEAADEKEAHEVMDKLLYNGELDAAVTMHYSFPIGVSTVGKVITPGKGKEMYIATTTGTSATERISGMLKNAIYGIAVARACGNNKPTIGILNIDGARHVERTLKQLEENGFPIDFAQSARSDGGVIMRGNDLILGTPDIMITDSLTGNVLMKMFSAFSSGGNYEAVGYGYGPGIGEKYDKIICILSRVSGASVVANAIKYAGDLTKGNLTKQIKKLFKEAKKADINAIIKSIENSPSFIKKDDTEIEVTPPPVKIVTEEIPGIEILELDNAAQLLWKNGIYATTGMGCTGPIIQVAEEDKEKALFLLKEGKFL